MKSYVSLFALSALVWTVAACSDDPSPPAANHKPVATIANASGIVGTAITLDGSSSKDEDGDKITFAWALKTVPATSKSALDKTDIAKPSFTPDIAGKYVVSLIVNDGKDSSAEFDATVNVTGGATNHKPVANAGADANAAIGAAFTLDGSKSTDEDKDALKYAWTLKAPDTSKAVLDKIDSDKPSFTPDIEGVYTATLIVDDGKDKSDAVSVKITAKADAKPVAVPGTGFVAKTTEAITLDASKSTDADKDKLTFAWTLDKKPDGSAAALKDATTDKPSFTPDKAGSYVLSLVADDGLLKSDKATIEIVAQEGTLKPLARIVAPASPKIATDVVIDGSTSLGEKDATLTYAWTLKAKPDTSTATLPANADKLTFKADIEGKYTFELKINDGKTDSDPADVDVTFAK